VVRIASLQDLALAENEEWSSGVPRRPFAGPDEIKLLDVFGRSLALYREGEESAALDLLLECRRELRYVPIPVIYNIIWLSRRLGREQLAAHECIRFARDAFSLGYDDLGLEACSAALILDALGDYEITRNPSASVDVARMYGAVAGRHGGQPVGLPPVGGDRPRRVALVVPNLVDYIVAATKRVLQFARYLDRSRYRLAVYVSENLSRRESSLFPFGCVEGRTEESGADTLRRLRELDVPVHLGSRSTRFVQSALVLADWIKQDGADIAIFQSGLACPIDWLAARWTHVPVKMCIQTGCSLFVPGMHATFFDSAMDLERERAWWSNGEGERILLPKGADLEDLHSQKPFSRARFTIPNDAVIIGTLSNHLDRRLSVPFMDVIAGVLQAHPDAWFLAFGADPLPVPMAYFRSRGVAERVRFGGKQSQAGSALKVLDIYANEFPVGGSQSVMEAMACGVPVVALRWSNAHAESVGAELAGEEFGIHSKDLQAYTNRLNEWVRQSDTRRNAGLAARRRAANHFSAQAYVRRLLDVAERFGGAELSGGSENREPLDVWTVTEGVS
jgi:glycosyltransferase involved in cell wall biosynthesis